MYIDSLNEDQVIVHIVHIVVVHIVQIVVVHSVYIFDNN